MSILTPTIKIFCDEVLKTGKGFSEIRRLLVEQGWQQADIATVLEEYVRNADLEEQAEAKLVNGGPRSAAVAEKGVSSVATTSIGGNFPTTANSTTPTIAPPTTKTSLAETTQPTYFNAGYNLNTPVPGMPEYATYIAQHKAAEMSPTAEAAPTPALSTTPNASSAPIMPKDNTQESTTETTMTEDTPSFFSTFFATVKKRWHWGIALGILGGILILVALSTYAYAAWVNPFVFNDARESLFTGIYNRLNTEGLVAAGVVNVTFEDFTTKGTVSSLNMPFELTVDHKGPSTFMDDIHTPNSVDNIDLNIKEASLSLPPSVYPLGTLQASAEVRLLNDQKKTYFYVENIPLPLKVLLGSFDITKQWFVVHTDAGTTSPLAIQVPTIQDISPFALQEAAKEAVRIDVTERIAGGMKILFTFNLNQYEAAVQRAHPGIGNSLTSSPTGRQIEAAFERLHEMTGTAIIGDDKKLKSLILNSSASDTHSRLASTLTIAFTPDEKAIVQAPADARDFQAYINEQKKKAAATAAAAKKTVKKKAK